jgi:hypothetical protein
MFQSRAGYNVNVIILPLRWRVYCFLSTRGSNAIKEWLDKERISTAQRAMFQLKIKLLENGGPDVVPGFISDTPVAKDIYKAKIKGNKGWVQLRPMLCKGPWILNWEYTFLFGTIEKNGALTPKDWKDRAQENRNILLGDPKRRRNEGVI